MIDLFISGGTGGCPAPVFSQRKKHNTNDCNQKESFTHELNAGKQNHSGHGLHMDAERAGGFYAVHKERPFYNDLVAYMTSGPVMVQVLEGEDAIAKNREVMGATNPADAAAGTIRADFAESLEANSVHGSDAPETAVEEIAYFFDDSEICPR